MAALVLFPVHLFPLAVLKESLERYAFSSIWLVEHPAYFTRYKFHKLKLVYHRASMKSYQKELSMAFPDCTMHYVEYHNIEDNKFLSTIKSKKIIYFDPVDHALSDSLAAESKGYSLTCLESPSFLCTKQDLAEYIDTYLVDTKKAKTEHGKASQHTDRKKYTHDSSFYRWQRRRLNVLMGRDGSDPQQWTYDADNRAPFKDAFSGKVPPTAFIEPKHIKLPENEQFYYKEACEYIEKHFAKNPGSLKHCIYPLTTDTSLEWLQRFLEERLPYFGRFQDNVHPKHPFLSHSLLSPMLNNGLLTPKQVLTKTLDYCRAEKGRVPIAALEGFLRQVIGWREYVRFLYQEEGKTLMDTNYFNLDDAPIPAALYHAPGSDGKPRKLGILPIDDMIEKTLNYAYCHHIERLMYLGVMMNLLGIHPRHAYDWFMELFIDAYDWVMLPNVVGMACCADGGLMMTRPYLCASNYVLRMSAYTKDASPFISLPSESVSWNRCWDALYYRFIDEHQDKLRTFYATARNVAHWDKKDPKERKALLRIANEFLQKLRK